MSLPSPSSGADWNSYKITTPTFQLTPIEKPDMSPFLVHMTGKKEIIQILEGKNAGEGFLRASVPEQLKKKNYEAKVVCFTESPTFALDFFRYRSQRRWETNQKFGIGFDKNSLVSKRVRPVIYADTELTKNIIHDYNYHILNKQQKSSDNPPKTALVKLLEYIYPLLFPLLENEDMQGFMWEREWRATQEDGFIFSHKDIKIICCPQEEEKAIRDILGNAANDIQFIRTWIQYDDVTQFLERQQQTWRDNKVSLNQVEQEDKEIEQEDKEIEQEDKNIQQIRALIEHKEITNNQLNSYYEFISRLEGKKEKIEKESKNITDEINDLKTQLAELEKKKVLADSLLVDTNPAS
jgi:CRISPR/Cas system CSM-associated protein Csm2 small subunit